MATNSKCARAQYTDHPTNTKLRPVSPCKGERINGALRYDCSFCDKYKEYVKAVVKGK